MWQAAFMVCCPVGRRKGAIICLRLAVALGLAGC